MKKLMLIPLLALLAACGRVPVLPSISDSGQVWPGKFVWHDLVTPNPAAAQEFYGRLFGWTFVPVEDSGYFSIRQDGQLIGGLVDANRIGHPVKSAVWLNALSVPDVDAATRTATRVGGRVLHLPRTLEGRGRFAVIMDRDGAVLQLLRAQGGDPRDEDPKLNQWLWMELITEDPADAARFYVEVAGYTPDTAKDVPLLADGYQLLVAGGKPRAGVVENPFASTRAAWIPYVRVADARKSAEQAVQLGGQLILAPDQQIRQGTVALILDPSGAPIALQEWTDESKEVR